MVDNLDGIDMFRELCKTVFGCAAINHLVADELQLLLSVLISHKSRCGENGIVFSTKEEQRVDEIVFVR